MPRGLYAGQNPVQEVTHIRPPRTSRIIVPATPGSRIMMFTKNAVPVINLINLSALPIFICMANSFGILVFLINRFLPAYSWYKSLYIIMPYYSRKFFIDTNFCYQPITGSYCGLMINALYSAAFLNYQYRKQD